MSAETSKDVAFIQDEDVLRKMWHETEDFGRKKEIRSHMYKLREQRLKEFYNEGDIEIRTTGGKVSLTPTHADSLADHSFLSLKSKEVRDSESPTKDVSYKISTKHSDQGWQIASTNQTSSDGKTHTTSQVATKAGTQEIEGGKIDFAAKNEQIASVYQDGDDKNFTKSVKAQSNTVIKQEAVGGDDHSNFKSSSTKSSSTSRVVTDFKSTSGDDFHDVSNATLLSRKVYTDDAPSDIKNHPSFVPGKTQVIRETKTLPDGTTLTTTKYEIRGVSTSKKESSSHSSSVQTSKSNVQQSLNSTKAIKYSPQEEQVTRQVTKRNDDQVALVDDVTSNRNVVESKATTVNVQKSSQVVSSSNQNLQNTSTRIVSDETTVNVPRDESRFVQDVNTSTTTTTTTKTQPIVENVSTTHITQSKNVKDTRQQFIDIERQHETDTRAQEVPQFKSQPKQPSDPQPSPYQQPERREPCKPPVSELDQPTKPTDGQYVTTYRTDYTNKNTDFTNRKISTEVSPTHDAFARSLRAVSPERVRSSNPSLRRSTSPDRARRPQSFSPSTRKSQDRFSSSETITYSSNRTTPEKKVQKKSPSPQRFVTSDTITRKSSRDDTTTTKKTIGTYSTDTITRKSKVTTEKGRIRSPSPISTVASDIEFIRNIQDVTTDLDEETTTNRPNSLEITTKKTKKVTERSPTSPLIDSTTPNLKKSPSKELTRSSSLRSPSGKTPPEDRTLKRTDTYEERCRQILGLTDTTERRRSSLERNSIRRKSEDKPKTQEKSPSQQRKTPERTSPEKKTPKGSEFPSQRRSPEKSTAQPYPEKQKSIKQGPKISEFPSQVRKSPEKTPLEQYPTKQKPTKEGPKIAEFPSQIRKSPEKLTKNGVPEYPGKKFPEKVFAQPYNGHDKPAGPKISEFPSQIRKTPERDHLEPYPEKNKPTKQAPKISEFPSQIRKTPEKDSLEPYPEKQKPVKEAPKISEFPAQIKKTPEKTPLGPYPEKQKPIKEGPKVSEFPSQIKKTPEKNPLEPYPEKQKPAKDAPKISEFPSQVKKIPEKQPFESFPEKQKPVKQGPGLSEFPSQIRKSPEKQIPDIANITATTTVTKKTTSTTDKTRKSPKSKKPDEESSTDSETEEVFKKIYITDVEGKVPVSEPEISKKFISQLCREDEVDRRNAINSTKKLLQTETDQEIIDRQIEKEILQTDTTKKTTQDFIHCEIDVTNVKKETVNLKDKTKVTRTPDVKKVEKPKAAPQPKFKPKTTPQKDQKQKITLMDVENLSEEDKSVHIRTHRIDETVGKKTVTNKILTNGDITKKAPSPKTPTTKTTKTVKKPFTPKYEPKKPVERLEIVAKPKSHGIIRKTTVTTEVKRNQVTPKTTTIKPEGPKTPSSVSKITKTTVATKTTPKKKANMPKKISNGHVPDSEEDEEDSLDETEVEKVVLTTSTATDTRKVVVDLLRSKSSREPTPDRLCPVPLSSDDESTGSPRYPDTVIEPVDDTYKKPKRLSDIPIMETETTSSTTTGKFIDVTDVKETVDESLLTVSDKVSKFISTAEHLVASDRPKSPRCQNYPEDISSISNKVSEKITHFTTNQVTTETDQKPARKVDRPDLTNVDESIKGDDCLLSVSDKVSKFITTADKLTKKEYQKPVSLSKIDVKTTTTSTVRDRKSPPKTECVTIEKESQMFTRTTEKTNKHPESQTFTRTPDRREKTPEKTPRTDVSRKTPERTPVSKYPDKENKLPRKDDSPKFIDTTPKSSKSDTKTVLSQTGRLRSTESIKKAKALFENISKEHETKTVAKKRLDYEKEDKETLKSTKLVQDTTEVRSKSPHYMSPLNRKPHDHETVTKTEVTETHRKYQASPDRVKTFDHETHRRYQPSPDRDGTTPHYRLPLDRTPLEHDTVTRSEISSHESRRTYQPSPDHGDTPHYRSPLDRTPHDRDTSRTNITTTTYRDEYKYKHPSPDRDGTSHYMLPLDRATHDYTDESTERQRVNSQSPDRAGTPHYMLPLDRTPHDHPDGTKPDHDTRRNRHQASPDRGETPHYMLPLERDQYETFTTQEERRQKLTDNTTHYKTPHEKYVPNSETPHYMLPLEKDHYETFTTQEERKQKLTERFDNTTHNKTSHEKYAPNGETPHYMLPLDRTSVRSRETSTEREIRYSSSERKDSISDREDVPHYMLPLDRNARLQSPHRQTSPAPGDQIDSRTTKFGVTLKRTDSGREYSTERRKSSITLDKRVTEEEIEEIFELEILEELLIKVVSYELRKKIRTQIRLVKKLISENTLESYIAQRKKVVKQKDADKKTEYKKKASPERIIKSNQQRRESVERTTEYKSSYERKTSSETIRREKSSRETTPVKDKPRTSPDRKITNTKLTQLKKTVPFTKTPVEDDKPEWTKQRNLRKTSEQTGQKIVSKTTTTTTSSTTTSTNKKEKTPRTSPGKELKTTDLITSSYGVGPTDENGTPLFGLKALRAQNKNTVTKVQGTVMTSEYRSENGHEPVGQVTFTKYSTDPKDLGTGEITVDNRGITSVTTTQKFGYKDTPSLKSLTNKQKKITNEEESTLTTKTAKITRKNSVKAISQKFIDNAVETSKSEKQTSYPKAGLILRTSSFKDPTSDEEVRNTSPADRQCESVTVRKSSTTSSTRTVSGDTFLTNKNRVTGVRDVLDRMKTEEHREGDTDEDMKARDLLNKFIGSQVILSGMEAKSVSSSTSTKQAEDGTMRSTTKITTTVSEGGIPVTKTRVFQHPITQEELDTIWDEQTLRLLLEQTNDYEERRSIRARLRQVMAEQEACTELVEKASREDPHRDVGSLEGESSNLLPLLQGLLEAPDSEHHADSGIESGEDQRTGLIAEVQLALDKLSASLRSDAADIVPERRTSLLQLVAKLQAGLSTTAPPPKLERRLSSGAGRFASKRKGRQTRHTVGVSSEELADARRLIEEISLGDVASSKTKLDLQKQNSESSVTSNSSSFNKFTPSRTAVKNATAKPFNSSSNSVSNASSSSLAQTPTDASEHLDFLFGDEPAHHKTPPLPHLIDKKPTSPLEEIQEIKSVHQAVQAAARKKVNSESVESETEEEDANTVKEHNTIDKTPSPNLLQENPIYTKPPEKSESSNSLSYEEKVNRFNTQTKKLKMKRANTIDIPKSLKFYEDQDDSDSDEDEAQKRKNTYYALRGPIRVNTPVHKTNVPVFEPKTKTDQKFLHFLHKNQENPPTNRPTSMWSHQTNKTPVWGSKFGNIKNNFESGEKSAKNFWKTQDDATGMVGSSQFGPRISKQSAKNLQQMFEEKQKQSNIVTGSLTVKTEPERTYKFVPQPLPVNKFSHAPQSAFKPLPKKAPDNPEIFKKELNQKPDEAPLFLYSPKPMFNSQESSASTSPVTSKPWVSNAIEHGGRVLSMVAKKFETPHHEEPHHIKPRKLSKEYQRVFAPKETPAEKLSAPYLVKSTEKTGNTVRKLSQEYDKVPTPTNYAVTTTVKYQPVQETRHHYVPPYKKPQSFTTPTTKSNYHHQEPDRIQTAPQSPSYYGGHSPKKIYNQKEPPFVRNPNQQFQPVNYSIRYDQPGVVHNTPPPSQPTQVYHQAETVPHYTTRMQFSIKPETEPPKLSVKSEPQVVPKINGKEMVPRLSVKPEPERIKGPSQVVPRISVKPEPELPKLQTQVSSDSLHEYNAISSKVMIGPVSQQAVTVRQKSPMSRNEHDMEAAFNIKNSLQQLGRRDSSKSPSNHKYNTPPASPQNSFKYKSEPTKEPIRIEVKPTVAQTDNKTYGVVKPFQQIQQKPTPIYNNVNRKLRQESSETNEKGQNVVHSKFHIPVINVAPGTPPAHAKMLSKSDSWHQICMANKPAAPVKSTQNPVLKSKSSHSLAVPQKQFEAGMSKEELVQKRRSIEAYFSTGKSPVKRSINRIKTSEKVSASSQSMSTLSRSRTLPDIVCPDLLDESNPDKAFEDLFKSAA